MEAIDEGSGNKLCEELGDLLMHIVLHSQIAREEGEFSIKEVLQGISNKLVHRHPHVFGNAEKGTSQDVALGWELLKQEERGADSILAGLPRGMPALAYGEALQRRAARVGFDWREIGEVIDKVSEEARELQNCSGHEERAKEFGDLLFSLVNAARRLAIDPEEALRSANEKFRQRFRHMEEICHHRGVSLGSLTLEQQDALWEDAKKVIP